MSERSRSGLPLKSFYSASDHADKGTEEVPGAYPFTRGRLRPASADHGWIYRELSGEGDAKPFQRTAEIPARHRADRDRRHWRQPDPVHGRSGPSTGTTFGRHAGRLPLLPGRLSGLVSRYSAGPDFDFEFGPLHLRPDRVARRCRCFRFCQRQSPRFGVAAAALLLRCILFMRHAGEPAEPSFGRHHRIQRSESPALSRLCRGHLFLQRKRPGCHRGDGAWLRPDPPSGARCPRAGHSRRSVRTADCDPCQLLEWISSRRSRRSAPRVGSTRR